MLPLPTPVMNPTRPTSVSLGKDTPVIEHTKITRYLIIMKILASDYGTINLPLITSSQLAS